MFDSVMESGSFLVHEYKDIEPSRVITYFGSICGTTLRMGGSVQITGNCGAVWCNSNIKITADLAADELKVTDVFSQIDNFDPGVIYIPNYFPIGISNFPVIYTIEHGSWLLAADPNSDGWWAWDQGLESWIWASAAVYPWVFRLTDEDWLMLHINPQQAISNRWFYSTKKQQWIDVPYNY